MLYTHNFEIKKQVNNLLTTDNAFNAYYYVHGMSITSKHNSGVVALRLAYKTSIDPYPVCRFRVYYSIAPNSTITIPCIIGMNESGYFPYIFINTDVDDISISLPVEILETDKSSQYNKKLDYNGILKHTIIQTGNISYDTK